MRAALTAGLLLATASAASAAGFAIIPVSPSPGEHSPASHAGADGIVSWQGENANETGTREVTARCTLNGETVVREWTYSVE